MKPPSRSPITEGPSRLSRAICRFPSMSDIIPPAAEVYARRGVRHASASMGYRVVDTRVLEGRRKLVARELGARAIKLNRFDNEPGQPGKEHDERDSGQEELYVSVAGSGRIVVDGDEVALE